MLAVNRIYCMDAFEGLKKLDDESVDLIVTDPPFNIAAKGRSTIIGNTRVSTMEAFGKWDCFHPFDYDVFIMRLLSECYRVLKPGGSLYLATSREQNGWFIRQAIQRGFTYRNQLVTIKTTQVPSLSKKNWLSSYDVWAYLCKDAMPKTFNFLSHRECVNTFTYPIRHKQTKHPTEKPLAFVQKLIAVSSNPSDLVLDPFMGSGTTAVAAQLLDRQFIGFEREKEYVGMARGRLNRRSCPPTKLRSNLT